MMKKNETSRIAIVGAGAAGLVAAETLRELGYQNVSLLEKESRVGGKCCSYPYEGKIYELGAGLIAGNNRIICDLIHKYNISLSKVDSYTDNLYSLETGKKIDNIFSLPENVSFLWQLLLKYRRLCHRYESLKKTGYDLLDDSLCKNFRDWANENNIPLILKNFERYFTGFGYGYWEEIPAAHVLKYIDWETVKSFLRGDFYVFPTSIQSLWDAVAAQHEVQYNSHIKRINRVGGISIETNTGTNQYDYVLISSPLDEALRFLDASEEEQFLFSRILHNDYQCYAFSIEGFPDDTGFLPEYFDPTQKNQPLFWYKRFSDSDFYTFYVLGDGETSQAQIQGNIEKVIKRLGGSIKRFHTCRKWKYFPRFSPKGMKNGFYGRLENLQGKRGTYFIGELPSYSTVELTASHAKQLVEQFF